MSLRWATTCQGCGRERECESRELTHAAKVLCDECAAKPHRLPTASGLDEAFRDRKTARSGRRASAPTFRLLSYDDLLNLPDPEWLIDGLLPEGLAVLYGPPSAFKSFVALDWALSVATGLPWHGRDVKRGNVVYVAAEGARGLARRVEAWRQAHGDPDVSRFLVVPDAVNLLDEAHVTAAKELVDRANPTLLVIDTMARSMTGGDENSSRDVGLFVDALDSQAAMTRLVVHHAGMNGTERGSTALRGAADVVAKIEREGQASTVSLICDKPPKDGEQWPTMTLRAQAIADSLVMELEPVFSPAIEVDRRKRVLELVASRGQVSQNEVVKAVGGKAAAVRVTLDQLAAEGALIEDAGSRSARLFSLRPPDGDEVGTKSAETLPEMTSSQGEAHPRRGCPLGTNSSEPSTSLSSRSSSRPGRSSREGDALGKERS